MGINSYFNIKMLIEALKIILLTIYLYLKTVFGVIFKVPITKLDLFKTVIESNTIITGVYWIDNAIFVISSLIPSILLFYLSIKGFNLSGKVSASISLILYIVIIALFSAIWFWVIVLLSFLFLIIFLISNKDL